VELPLARLDQREEQMMANFTLFGFLYVLSLASVGYLVVWRFVLRPIRALSTGMERVAAGDLEHSVPARARDELGRLAAAFNDMTAELATARRRAERWTQSLEEEVAKKTEEVRATESKLAETARLAALGRLTAEIAHEIRNPLTALGGYGRRLQRTVSTVEEREYARIVVDEASRLENLLKDVLDFSGSGHFTFRSESLTPVVEQSLEAFDMRCVERGIRVAVDLSAGEPVALDAGQARRALDNLMANAIDAMPHGGSLSVSTRLEEQGGARYVVVRVEDSGPGIPAENLPRIFEPFWTTKRMGKGTGLGLPITRTIVEAHGGFVRMQNGPGGGLTASLWFPVDGRPEPSPA
jgi:signal transduction histidine kinase